MFKSFFSRKKANQNNTRDYLNLEHKMLAVIRTHRTSSIAEDHLLNEYFNDNILEAYNVLIDYKALGYVSGDSILHLTKAGLYHLDSLNLMMQQKVDNDLKHKKTAKQANIAIVISILSLITSTAISLTALLMK